MGKSFGFYYKASVKLGSNETYTFGSSYSIVSICENTRKGVSALYIVGWGIISEMGFSGERIFSITQSGSTGKSTLTNISDEEYTFNIRQESII